MVVVVERNMPAQEDFLETVVYPLVRLVDMGIRIILGRPVVLVVQTPAVVAEAGHITIPITKVVTEDPASLL